MSWESRKALAELNRIINTHVDDQTIGDPVGHDLARFVKIIEELGEAATELIATHALNFRKTKSQVAAAESYAGELLDGALTLLLAHHDWTDSDSMEALEIHLANTLRRARQETR